MSLVEIMRPFGGVIKLYVIHRVITFFPVTSRCLQLQSSVGPVVELVLDEGINIKKT